MVVDFTFPSDVKCSVCFVGGPCTCGWRLKGDSKTSKPVPLCSDCGEKRRK